MRPLDAAEIQQDFLTREPILLLDTTKVAIRFVIQLVLADKFPVLLPTELWLDIIEQYHKASAPKYEAVRPTSITASPTGQVLHCRLVKLNLGDFESEYAVLTAEQLLESTHAYDEITTNFYAAEDTDTVYAIEYPRNAATTGVSSTITALRVPACLFIDITVPDVIARLDDGRCWVCEGEREICPGCTRGVANEFDAFMGCGVDLACPLCMGLDFMQEDKAFLQKYYRDGTPAKEEEARKARVSARLAELGYDQKRASDDDSDRGLE
ncbi:MAG: hypothetical protein L6R38_002055 [Xanthoria sp. 2 TBL-2021]|nr:MAG: hypothetical protein L6R38_002055 [Xanthoria sp. 2 TBL-2021]